MTYRRIILALAAVGLVACLVIGVRRERHEHRANRVEIVMDDADFSSLARSYAYNERSFLIALRRAGLTSLAVQEELGGQVSSSTSAVAYAGSTLLDQARLSGLKEPVLADLARRGAIAPNEMYVIAYDAATAARYARQLPLKFPHAVHVLRGGVPSVYAIRTEADFFAATGLGLPGDRVALARSLGLALVPRLQNDERMREPQLRAMLDDASRHNNAHTVVFFGLRNQVLGYPDNLDAAADAMRDDHLNFGSIETYDAKTLQAGNAGLAKDLPDHTVRVQAIAKPEQDKLRPEEIVQRYLLGVRERNVRVVYMRPFAHEWDGRSIEATNVELVKEIATGIRKSGLRTGADVRSGSPFDRFISVPWQIAIASLAVPAVVVLLLAEFGLGGVMWAVIAVAIDLVLVFAGFAVHHDMAVRKMLGLIGAILYPVLGFVTIAAAFRMPRAPSTGAAILDGLRVLAIGLLVTLGGVIVVVGLLSTPLTMLEVDRVSGVKLVLALPPLIALALYLFTPRWGMRTSARALGAVPVTVLQLVAGAALLGAGYIVLARSGNSGDIAPSSLELALRAHLTTLLQVRPRTKEFLFGFPALMLVPVLVPADRARWGWLFALAIGMGLADVVDTFCHLHTHLTISVERLVNGGILGIIIGAIAIVVYRKWRPAA